MSRLYTTFFQPSNNQRFMRCENWIPLEHTNLYMVETSSVYLYRDKKKKLIDKLFIRSNFPPFVYHDLWFRDWLGWYLSDTTDAILRQRSPAWNAQVAWARFASTKCTSKHTDLEAKQPTFQGQTFLVFSFCNKAHRCQKVIIQTFNAQTIHSRIQCFLFVIIEKLKSFAAWTEEIAAICSRAISRLLMCDERATLSLRHLADGRATRTPSSGLCFLKLTHYTRGL